MASPGHAQTYFFRVGSLAYLLSCPGSWDQSFPVKQHGAWPMAEYRVGKSMQSERGQAHALSLAH